MSQDDDRPTYLDREKKSFSELDRMRHERRDGHVSGARSPTGRARTEDAAKQHLKKADTLFGGNREAARKLAQAMHDARGTDGLADACRAYREALGLPTEMRDISCFLDAGVAELVLAGLEGLRALNEGDGLQPTSGLRTQLRMLAQDPDDAVAEVAEELLELI